MIEFEVPGVRTILISTASAPVEAIAGSIKTFAKLTLFAVATLFAISTILFVGQSAHVVLVMVS